jgi:Fe-S-cluster containining protein
LNAASFLLAFFSDTIGLQQDRRIPTVESYSVHSEAGMATRKRSRRTGRRKSSGAQPLRGLQGHAGKRRSDPVCGPFEQWRAILSRALRSRDPEQEVLEVVRSAMEHLDATLAANTPPKPLDCERGCHFCCHTHVSVTPLETFAMLDYMDACMAPADQEAAVSRILALCEDIQGKDHREIYEMRQATACAFLREEGCQNYPARPIICRSWHCVNRAYCQMALTGDDSDAVIENFPARLDYGEQMQRGMLCALEERGIENGLVISTKALGKMLRTGDWREAFRAWLSGNRVFSRSHAGTSAF